MKKTIVSSAITTVLFLLINGTGFTQNVGINTIGALPDPSSKLDVSSTNAGLLIPRMTTVQRDAISNPAQSLLVYNLTSMCLQIWENSQWNNIWCSSGCSVPSLVSASAAPNPICENQTLTLTGIATDATSWSWSGPNGFTSTAQSPTIASIITAGAGIYTLTASNACGSAAPVNSASVAVNSLPAAVTVSGGGTFCGSTTLTASGGNGGTIYWQGTTTGGISTTTPSTSQNISSSGTYYFRANNSCGWGTEGSATVTISTPAPGTPGAISGPATVTGGSTGNVYTISSVTNATSYTWTVPCGATITAGQGTTSITVSYTSNPSSLLYTTPGTFTENCITGATIEVIGAGGNGGGNGGGGGGGGGYANGTYSGLSGTSLTVTVGSGGSGTATSVGSFISASAGANGTWVANPGIGGGGVGGIGSGGTIANRTGGTGGGGYWTYVGGGGAGAAGSTGNGSDGSNTVGSYPASCGVGTPWLGGAGGAGGGSPAGSGGAGGGFSQLCNSANKICGAAGSDYGGGGGGGNGDGCTSFPGAGGYCSITSITYGGNITVTADNSCGSSAASTLSVTINP